MPTTTSSLRFVRIIQAGLLALVALMPFHAFLTTWLGTTLGHRAAVQSWKEVLLIGLALVGAGLAWHDPAYRRRWRAPWVYLAAGLAACAVLVTLVALSRQAVTPSQALLGAKIDLEFLVAGLLTTLVAGQRFSRWLIWTTIGAGVAVSVFVLMQVYVWPVNFLSQFGYGPTTILPFQYVDAAKTLRYAGTLGGPNQLGAYLIIPLSLTAALTTSRRRRWWLLGTPLMLFALYYSFSRSAWVGALASLALLLIWLVPRRWRWPVTGSLLGLLGAGAAVIWQQLASHPQLQHQLLHTTLEQRANPSTSSAEHVASLLDGLSTVARHPLGQGLGSAGPATIRTGQSYVIENQFLQVGAEAGWLGLGLFVLLLGWLVRQLRHSALQPWGTALAAALVGISVGGLFIPTWDDSTTALVAFTLAGSLAGLTGGSRVKPNPV
ncbi:MAG TPA: O-antigen ligase family protein [Candidatus Saccharimonadia bacterium]